MKLHLGCGHNKIEGYVNCDISPTVKPDRIVDLENPLPFKTNSIEEIICINAIEHLGNPEILIEECWRVCRNGATILIETNHASNFVANSLLGHKRTGLSAFSFKDYTVKHKRNYYSQAKFKIRIEYVWFKLPGKSVIEWILGLNFIFSEYVLTKFFPFNNIRFKLTVIKNEKIKPKNKK
ncbi:MAG: methyltransferase domain-containing protein [archaeon]|jgi:SAM-dependent methyltransferase